LTWVIETHHQPKGDFHMAKPAAPARSIDEAKMNEMLGRVVSDFGATASSALVLIGDRLGFYKTLASDGPLTSAELAQRTQTAERYVREWLINQAAGGYVTYDPATRTYSLTPEQTAALADDANPLFVAGGFELFVSLVKDEEQITELFRTGKGMQWGAHHSGLFRGCERFFRPGYLANLVEHWIPSLEGVQAKLEAGATVADVGCGHGASTLIMAQAFPKSRFFGFDDHAGSIERARDQAKAAGLDDRVFFEVAGATNFPGGDYDLIAFFDCLHDMGDPAGALRHTRETLATGGTVLLVEPMAGETVEANFNPVGRIYSAASVLVCTPNAVATGPVALGTVATEHDLQGVAEQAGFTRFRRAMDTPFNRLFEVRA
jgi:SAM-dependent methyltransferase